MKLLALTIGGYSIQATGGVPTGGINEVWVILRTFVQLAFWTGIILAFFFFIISAFRWMTSGGDKQKIQQARNGLTYSIIGLVIIFLALFIVIFIGKFFGVSLI